MPCGRQRPILEIGVSGRNGIISELTNKTLFTGFPMVIFLSYKGNNFFFIFRYFTIFESNLEYCAKWRQVKTD